MNALRPEISVVILCYRAEDFTPIFVSQVKKVLEARKLNYELVLVGNYNSQSNDRTPKIVQELAARNSKIQAVVKEKMGMMGWDMRTGLEVATGDSVAVIDGDGQMPPEDIIKVYDKLISGGYDIVKTYRDLRFDGKKRVFISRVYNLFLRTLFPKVKIRDANSKPKIFTREALKKLQLMTNDWFIDGEIIIKASYLNISIGEVPTNFYLNKNRASFVRTATIFEFIKNLILYSLYRLRIFLNNANK